MHGTPRRPSASGIAARGLEPGPCLFPRFPAMALTHGALSEEEASMGPDDAVKSFLKPPSSEADLALPVADFFASAMIWSSPLVLKR